MSEKEHYIQLQLNEQECILMADALSIFADCEPFDTRVDQALDMAVGMQALAKGLRLMQQREDDIRRNGEP